LLGLTCFGLAEGEELGSNLLHAAERGGKQCSVERPRWPAESPPIDASVTVKKHPPHLSGLPWSQL
jgi:hypothetical protein